MDRLAEQVVDWHNRHPLAKRITLYDVHTIGVIALPFMRSGPPGLGSPVPIEPTLTNEVSPASLQQAWHEGTTVAADDLHPNAAEMDALADHEVPARSRNLLAILKHLPALFRQRDKTLWPVFRERFIDNLSVRRISAFAMRHGYSTKPGDDSWPLRTVPIDDAMASSGVGAWPCEIYLKSAAIDAQAWRGRVLIGRGGLRAPVLGRRALDWRRVTLAVALIALLVGLPAWRLGAGSGGPKAAASAASAASAAASAHHGAASALAMPASAASEAASEPPSAASAPEAASVAASGPDIRPQIVPNFSGRKQPPRVSPPLGAGSSPEAASMPSPAEPQAAPFRPERSASAPPAAMSKPVVVALVGPASKDKAEAEKLLATMLSVLQPDPTRPIAGLEGLHSQVFLTPEGWRPAVYPFGSREEAQLVNAGLVARGLRTRAVNF